MSNQGEGERAGKKERKRGRHMEIHTETAEKETERQVRDSQ